MLAIQFLLTLVRIKALQADWNKLGEADFSFETLQQLKPDNESKRDILKKMQELEKLGYSSCKNDGESIYE